MKKSNLIRSIGFLAAFTSLSASGQLAKNNLKLDPSTLMHGQSYVSNSTDKSAIVASPSEESDKASLEKIRLLNEKMYHDFTKFFKGATDLRISDINGSTHIYCKVNNVPTRILYNKKGRWQHTIRYLTAANIPDEVSGLVEDAFPGFEIKSATAVSVGDKTAYLVNIQGYKLMKTIRVVGNEWDVYTNFSN